jgi:S1-C subfamily serine protease
MIGINSQILSPSGASAGVGFAIPVSIAKRVVPELIKNGMVSRPKLGVGSRDVQDLKGQVDLPVSEGVMIWEMVPNGSAAAAGLRGLAQSEDGEIVLGDIIVAIDGEKVTERDDLFRILDKHKVGDVVKVDIYRDNRKMSVPVRLLEGADTRRGIRR